MISPLKTPSSIHDIHGTIENKNKPIVLLLLLVRFALECVCVFFFAMEEEGIGLIRFIMRFVFLYANSLLIQPP